MSYSALVGGAYEGYTWVGTDDTTSGPSSGAYSVSTSDQLSFGDSVSRTGNPPDYTLIFGDALANIQDSVNIIEVYRLALTDTVNNLVDSVAKMVNIPIQAFDSQQFNWGDAVTIRVLGLYSQTPTDSINNYNDNVSTIVLTPWIFRSVSDSLNYLNDTIRIWNRLRLEFGDNFVLSDATQLRFNNLLKLVDQLQQFGEFVQLDKPVRPTFSDAFALSDQVTLRLTTQLSETSADGMNFSDSVVIVLSGNYNPSSLINRIRRYLGDTGNV